MLVIVVLYVAVVRGVLDVVDVADVTPRVRGDVRRIARVLAVPPVVLDATGNVMAVVWLVAPRGVALPVLACVSLIVKMNVVRIALKIVRMGVRGGAILHVMLLATQLVAVDVQGYAVRPARVDVMEHVLGLAM